MIYKLIATDMDGTILLNNKKLSTQTIAALRLAKEKGLEIVICTGRPFATVKAYLSQINIDCHVITNNGSVIRDKNHTIQYVNYLSTEPLKRVLSILAKEDVYYHACDEEMTYIDSFIKRAKITRLFVKKKQLPFYKEWSQTLWYTFFSRSNRRVDFQDYIAAGGRLTSIFIHSEEPEKLKALYSKLVEVEGIEITSSASDNLEVLDINSTKGNALKQLTEEIGVLPEEVVAVGDHLNDISMIEFAGLGVAMGNGDEEVMRRADWVTKTNEEDGFSYLMMQKVLAKEERVEL
jgi:Cof subfamily protein (haloacid dehalogenase superfamily)